MTAALAALALVSPVWKTDPVEVILHRSAGMVYPENTIPALEEAVKQGADGIEIDIRATLDGHLVLFHDDWLPDTLGPGAKIDDLTLAEARKLEIGARWGKEFRGLPLPKLDDVFDFARANNLLLFLDIKTKGIEEELQTLIQQKGVQELVIVPDPLAGDRPKIPFIDHWNYLDGGEEDPARMKAVIDKTEGRPARIMVDDARAVSAALNRKTENRPFIPYRTSPDPKSVEFRADLASGNLPTLRRGLWKQAQTPRPEAWIRVRELALKHPDPHIQLDAITALGHDKSPESKTILDQIAAEPIAQDPANHPSGHPYFDTYRLAAVALAYAHRNDEKALLAMASQPGFSPAAASLAATVASPPELLQKVLSADPTASGIPFAISFAGARPDAESIYHQAIIRGDGYARRTAVFNLVRLAKSDPSILQRLATHPEPKINQTSPLVKAWADGTWPTLIPKTARPMP